jgi:hypothetical protein
LSEPIILLDKGGDKIVKTDGTNSTTVLNVTKPSKIAVKKGSTDATTVVYYCTEQSSSNFDIKKVDLDGTDNTLLWNFSTSRSPICMAYDVDGDHVYILKTSTTVARMDGDGSNIVGALNTYSGATLEGIACNVQGS